MARSGPISGVISTAGSPPLPPIKDEDSMSSTIPLRAAASDTSFDPRRIRRDFPIFENNPGLVFLDSGASAQKPRQVIDAVSDYYRTDYANIHRGVYRLSAKSTDLYENARETVRRFLNAPDPREIVFTRNT